jgi:hypothetical protein
VQGAIADGRREKPGQAMPAAWAMPVLVPASAVTGRPPLRAGMASSRACSPSMAVVSTTGPAEALPSVPLAAAS